MRTSIPNAALCLGLILAPLRAQTDAAPRPGLDGERIVPLVSTSANRAVALMVINAAVSARYGGLEAPPGRAFLVLSTEWVNHIRLVRVKGKDAPTAYKVPDLRDQIYIVADGITVWQLSRQADGAPGVLPRLGFTVARPGETLKGNLLFDVPAGASPGSLALRYYDFAHGHMAMDLLGTLLEASPKLPALKNDVVEASVFDVQASGDLDGVAAPPGMSYVHLGVRARSTKVTALDASSFDPHAAPGAKVQVGTVADWKEARKYLQLVVDGQYGCAPLDGASFPDEPRFLPDLFTGGTVTFLVPADRTSLELRCDFPNAKSSLDGKTFRPQGLTLPVEGTRPALPVRKAIVSMPPDDVFRVHVTSQSAAGEFAGEKAAEGQRFFVLGITVENIGKTGEFFQTPKQLKVAGASGKPLDIDPISGRGAHAPVELLWVPAAERRSFEAVFRIPADEAKLRVLYAGLTLQKTEPLPPLDAAAAPAPVAAAAAAAAPSAVEKPSTPATEPAQPPPVQVAPIAPAAAVVAGAGQPLKPPRDPRGLAGFGLTVDQVNEAIDRGAAFLWDYVKTKDLKEKRLAFGALREHTLVALALIHADAHKKIPDFNVALKAFLADPDRQSLEVYQAGIRCMAIDAFGDPSYQATLRRSVTFLLELQSEGGSWSYSRSFKGGLPADPANEKVLLVSGGTPLDGSPLSAPLQRRTEWKESPEGDNSTSQYALLGLQAASRSGVRADADVWKRSIDSYRSRQGDDGNWHYYKKSSTGYGSMTCAGICSLAIARSEAGEVEPGKDPAILRGLDWLSKSFALNAHPGTLPVDRWQFYYLYSLERVGRILDLDFIGQHEWYPEGVKYLLSIRKEHGGWEGKHEELDPRLATSFALLFLTRATAALPAQKAARGGDGTLRTGILLPRANRYYLILDASGSMTAPMDGKPKWDIAREAVGRLIQELPDNSEVALRVYGHRKRAIEPGADEDTALELPLRKLVKKDFLTKLESLRSRGKTPLARSLLEAARDLSSAASSGPVTAILLTDGGEDTLPRQDPIAAAVEFGKVKNVRFHVVGFDIGREDWAKQLQEIARRAEGDYWPALKADSLYSELRSAVFGTPQGFTVSTLDGKEAGRGSYGDSLRLHEGKYLFTTKLLDEPYEELFWINTDATTSVVFNAARIAALKPSVRPAAGSAPPPTSAPNRPAAAAKFCTGCGTEAKLGAKFCTKCGAKFP